MPSNNNFQHAQYSRADPGDRVRYGTFQVGAASQSPAWIQAMSGIGAQLAAANVKGVLFLSGYPFGDLFGAARLDEVGGLKRGYSRGISGLESLLALLRPSTNGLDRPESNGIPPLENTESSHHTLDSLALEAGNFATKYVETFEKAINAGRTGENPIACSRYVWSSLFHHPGRVEATISLMEYLQQWGNALSVSATDRLLLIGHGHSGQLLALLSNITTRTASEARPRVFEILANYWEAASCSPDVIERLEKIFESVTNQTFLQGATIDVVTLGTAVRYGWDTDGVGNLLHIINHRPIRPDGKRWLAKMELPQTAWEMPYQTGGDYVQQLAVAGTDAVPSTPELLKANSEFQEIFEPFDTFERWLECTRRSTRCPNDGHCLLIEYGVQEEEALPHQHLYGHACYTHSRSMLFTALEIVGAFYPKPT